MLQQHGFLKQGSKMQKWLATVDTSFGDATQYKFVRVVMLPAYA